MKRVFLILAAITWAMTGFFTSTPRAGRTLITADQPLQAQAAPTAMGYAYYVSAVKDKGNATICVGDNVSISVNVWRTKLENGEPTNNQRISGIWVEGSVQDPSIGKLIMARKSTGWNNDRPGVAVFAFHADKAGTTTISFKAEIFYYKFVVTKWLFGPASIAESNPVVVKVEDCEYKVTATSLWSGFGQNFVARIDGAKMTADADGRYSGTATVNWIVSETQPQAGCLTHSVTFTSQADLTGSMDDDGQQLVVDLAYLPFELTWYTYLDCTNPNSTSNDSYTPSPLTISIPSSGGAVTKAQALVYVLPGPYDLSGSANVIVMPVTTH